MMLYKKKKLQENKNRHDWAKPMMRHGCNSPAVIVTTNCD